jgi:transposase-like protein
VFVPRYTEAEAREAVAESFTYTQVLRLLGLCPAGGNAALLKKWLARWDISTAHFDPYHARSAGTRTPKPLEEILVEGSTYARSNLKARLYGEGIKRPFCELCGQGEVWRNRPMGLILDHVNGVRDDNRLENLRIVCPNCAATLDTHCGRKNRLEPAERACLLCGANFRAKYPRQRYCSSACGMRSPRPSRGVPNPALRRVDRPPYDQLLREISETSYSAVGRRYGVSDNAVRKWVRQYEREQQTSVMPPPHAAAPR